MQSLIGLVGEHCAEQKTTRKAMASEVGVSNTAFRRKCDGRIPWKLNEAATMASLLGLSLTEFYEVSTRT